MGFKTVHASHLHAWTNNRCGLWRKLTINTTKACHCGTSFSVDHAMVCPFEGFPTFCHNEVCDLTVTLLTKVCHNVATEPPLQLITVETFPYATANITDNVCLDVKARDFWRRGQDAFFDAQVFYPNASSYHTPSLSSAYKHHEDVKKREYGHQVREVEHGVFTPLVFTSTGGMDLEATTFYKRLADLLATHWGQPYSTTIHWLRCHMSFALLHSAILCVFEVAGLPYTTL